MAHFPMFVDLSGKPCLVVGGGQVALRKVKALLDFGADITIVSPEVCPQLLQLPVFVVPRVFDERDCSGMTLVVAATDDRGVNHRIAVCCRKLGLPVNVIDSREESSFLFPAYQKSGDVVAAFSGSGNSPLIAQKLKEQMPLSPILGELNALLGQLRTEPAVRELDEAYRKLLYLKLYDTAMQRGSLPTGVEIQEWIDNGI